MNGWDALQYEKFLAQRLIPAKNLAGMIDVDAPVTILDIGCGTGSSTAVLSERFPDARVIGADNSPNMLDKARKDHPTAEFIFLDAGDIDKSFNGRFDIVFSNACLQWLPDHKALIPRLMELLTDGGQLLVQMPLQHKHMMYTCVLPAVLDSKKWSGRIAGNRKLNILEKEDYFDLLSEISSDFEIWETVYSHCMPSCESIVEWYKGTGLRPYLSQLDEKASTEFEKDILSAVRGCYKPRPGGDIIFDFPRLFFKARK